MKIMRWTTISLSVLCAAFVTYAVTQIDETPVEARLLPAHMRGMVPWKTIFEMDLEDGTALPAHTNVLIHIPVDVDKIYRKVLFGRKGFDIRYWGYCMPENYELALNSKRRGFPGRIFMSEKERAARREKEKNTRRNQFSLLRNFSEKQLNEAEFNRGRLRHQMEIFKGGATCYVMTEAPLPLGIDKDDDGVNTYVEKDKGSDPEIADTDGDGLNDGLEVFELKTSPVMRDTDGDGIVDGLEDANRNGRTDMGETNPLEIDSDRDGLCDGLCRVGQTGDEIRGEDMNLNGKEDDGETNPTKADSDGDGILDEQEYYNCVLETGRTCNYSAFNVE